MSTLPPSAAEHIVKVIRFAQLDWTRLSIWTEHIWSENLPQFGGTVERMEQQ